MTSFSQWLIQNFHPHLLLYTAIILFVIYRPPLIVRNVQQFSDFLTRHWGDSIGLYLLHLGVVLILIAGIYPNLSPAEHLGESFILTGVGMLKLRYIPKESAAPPNVPPQGA